jgi:hypothetical protein
MTAQPKRKQEPQRADREAPEPAGKPSQAEGERDTIEQDLGQRPRRSKPIEPDPSGKPSQAEGERDTIEQELGERKHG